MENTNRRNFVKSILLSSVAMTLSRSQAFTQTNVAAPLKNVRPLEMLALGDSVMWGQGLFDKNKFTFLTKDWLESELKKTQPRNVNLFVAAHSGASIESKSDKIDTLIAAKTYNGEINLFNPSIKQQAINAYKWYRDPKTIPDGFIPDGFMSVASEKNSEEVYGKRLPTYLEFYKDNTVTPQNVDLILVNGGINDLDVRNFVNPEFPIKKIEQAANDYCNERMKELLEKLALMFPNARIIITGYFPLISKETCADKAIQAMYAALGDNMAVRILQRLARKISITDEIIKNSLAERSITWVRASNEAFTNALNETNDLFPMKDTSGKLRQRIFFAQVYPEFIEDKNAYGTDLRKNKKKCPVGKEATKEGGVIENSFVWELGEKLKVKDNLYNTRVEKVCKINEIKGFNRLICERAGLLHPNEKGAKQFCEAIKKEIGKINKDGGWLNLS